MAAKKRKRKPATKRNKFLWDAKKTDAAQLLAEGNFNVEEIAAKVGVERTTLWRWQEHAEFAARVAKIEKRLGDLSMRRVIARRNRRLLALEDRWLKMQQVIADRAINPVMQSAPGGKTGLLVRRERMIGSGDNARLVEEFEVDTGLLKELREHEKQAAQECGQWIEKHAPTTPDGKDEYSGIPALDLAEFRQLPVTERIRILQSTLRIPLEAGESRPPVG